MNTTRRKYQVHAELVESGIACAGLEDAQPGQLIERSLNRMERVAAVYMGQIYNRLNCGLQIAFTTAEAAIMGACEMQHRCAALPQPSGNRLALRIGIHQGIELTRSKDGPDCTIDIASLLAVVNDGIVASGIVVAALSPELRKYAQPLNNLPPQIAAHSVAWRSETPTTAFWGKSIGSAGNATTQSGPRLVLRHKLNRLELTQEKPVLTVGRDPRSNLVLVSNQVSRNHCRIVWRSDCIELTDSSSNGTYVTPDKGDERRIAKGSVVLIGKGIVFFGRQSGGERRGGVAYEALY